MSCSRGKASPDAHTKLHLFADSAGYCQNPSCNKNLFLSIGEKEIHIAEMAHIFSANNDGPRAKINLTPEQRGNFSNLILLCPSCHTTIDKAEDQFPDILITKWKKYHSERINTLFNIVSYKTRIEARNEIKKILKENNTIFNIYGPLTAERFNPESTKPKIWKIKIHEYILPNNQKILRILENNYHLFNDEEENIFHLFKIHVSDFEGKHINGVEESGSQFPNLMNNIFED
ncbi:hypothetical protein [Hymenobacter psychrophilus]|uniref:HNH endonuclease n=1 Tax=Hymenobacter psychrophilus TaxID=651662 RepID=A0A1H3H1W0_9BACT|nr:hypothetical protein [Hymenobacter psychrophilus]SDY09522.1 hypothetical protein SAMN04488069_105265 [Hymenobacter psychrophilus]